MDFREARFKVLRSETMTNIWYVDTEGWLMPAGAPNFGAIEVASPKFWGWTGDVAGTAAVRMGGQWLGAQLNTTLVGTGAALTFGPVSFAASPLQVGSTSLWTTIGGSRYAWHDADGTSTSFSQLAHDVGSGAVGPYAFVSKAIALVAGTVQIHWTSGGNPYAVTDNGAGVFVDAKIAAATINYATGAISVTFAGGFAPDAATAISLSGTLDTTFDVFFNERLGIGDGTTASFPGTTKNRPIRTGSFLFSYTILGVVYFAEDDGAGNIVDITGAHVAGGSTVNYATGAVLLNLSTAPDQNTNIEMYYNKSGLIKSNVNYTTGQVISLEFAPGYPPDNLATLFLLSSHRDHSDFAGIDVVTSILMMNQAGKRIHVRDARGYLDSAAEGYDNSVYPHYCKPGDIFSLAAYIKRINGAETGFLRIRFWDGTSAYNQISAGTTLREDYTNFSGTFSVVDDPYDVTKKIYEFQIGTTTKHDKLTLAFRIPAGAQAFSVEFETDNTGVQEGDQIFSMSGLYLSQGTTAFSYSPPAEIKYLPRPTDGSGRLGRVLAWDEYGKTKWVDPQSLGVAAITSLNGLTASVQSFAIGTAGTSPGISSAINVHTFNIPNASTAGVTAGLVAYADWANWQAMAVGTFGQVANPNTFSREIRPVADNSLDLGGSALRWRNIYAFYGFYSGYVHVGSAIDYGRIGYAGASLVFSRAGAITNIDMTAYTQVSLALLVATTAQANRLYALGSSDVVHLEVIGDVLQTSYLFNIRNNSGAAFMRSDKTLAVEHVGRWDISNNTAGQLALRVRAAAGQTANLFGFQDSAGNNLVWATSAGVLGISNHAGVLAAGLFNIPQASSTGLLTPLKAGYSVTNGPTWTPITANTFIDNARSITWMTLGGSIVLNGRVDLFLTASISSAVVRLDTALGGIAINAYGAFHGVGVAWDSANPYPYPVQLSVSGGQIFLEVIDPAGGGLLNTGIYTVMFSGVGIS